VLPAADCTKIRFPIEAAIARLSASPSVIVYSAGGNVKAAKQVRDDE
jgi:hypothetical protein